MKLNFQSNSRIAHACLLLTLVSRLQGATFNIDISNFAFVPPNQAIKTGDTVTWMNSDLTTHTTVSGQPGAPDGLWNSGFLSGSQSFSHTFPSAGTFPYYCTLHTFMTASITVEASQGAPPTVTIT